MKSIRVLKCATLEQVLSNHKRLALEYRSAAPGEIAVVSQGGETQDTAWPERERTQARDWSASVLAATRPPLITRHSLSPVSA